MSSTERVTPIPAACAWAQTRAASSAPEATGVEAEDIVVGDDRAGTVAIRIYRPSPHKDPLPTLIYAHGTGDGARDDADRTHELARVLAAGSGAAVAVPDHSPLTPAARRTAVERCHVALAWTARHGHARGLDGRRVAVGGEAAGAAVALALALLVRRRRGPPLASQLLLCPLLDATQRGIELLPPTLVITAERDAVRDRGEAYADQLRAVGVDVIAVRYQGVGAGFMRPNPSRDPAHPTTAAIDQAARFLADTLGWRQRPPDQR